MNRMLKMTRALHDATRDRLRIPHSFAAERVAFAFGRRGTLPGGEVLILADVLHVDDADYEADPSVGARIGSTAIHKALQRALDLRAAAFHVHVHEHRGVPRFSRVD